MYLFELDFFTFSIYMPRSGIPGSYNNSIFNYVRNLCTLGNFEVL